MNILHMKYAVEVAKAGSINRAAQQLYIAQPNLSRCIKELESDLGITIFDRTFRGMKLTPEGEEFVQYARTILNQIDDIEQMFKDKSVNKQRFSISVPRASYISDAFVQFSGEIKSEPAEIYYMETNSAQAIRNILHSDYHLGIIRYASSFDKYFMDLLEENDLACELVAEFHYVTIMSREAKIAYKEEITFADLSNMIEIIHGDPYVPSLPIDVIRKEELLEDNERRIFLFERGGQFDLLTENHDTFMWVSPIPEKLLERYNLVQRECVDNTKTHKDVLIRKKNYTLSKLDNAFIEQLYRSRDRWL